MSEAERTGLDHVILPRRLPGLALLDRYHPAAGRQPARRRAGGVRRARATRSSIRGPAPAGPPAGPSRPGCAPWRPIPARSRSWPPSPADGARPGRAGRRVRPARRLAPRRRAAAPAHRGALRDALRDLPRPGGGGAVHLAARRRCARTQDLSLRRLRPLAAAPRSGRRRSTRSISPSSGIERAAGAPVDEPSATSREPSRRPGPTPTCHRLDAAERGPSRTTSSTWPIGEAGGPPPRRRAAVDPPSLDGRAARASPRRCVPSRCPVAAAEGVRQSPALPASCTTRFPVLDGRDDLVDELLDLYTPRNLYALHAIVTKIDTELRDTAAGGRHEAGAGGLPAAREPAERLPGPRRLAAHQRGPRPPAGAAVTSARSTCGAPSRRRTGDVRTAIAALARPRTRPASPPTSASWAAWRAANVLWLRCARRRSSGSTCRPTASTWCCRRRRRSPPDRRARLRVPRHRAGCSAARRPRRCAWSRSSAAAATPRVPRRRRCATAWHRRPARSSPAAGAVVLLEGADPERLLAVALAGAAAGLELVDVIHRESTRAGDGVVLHFSKRIRRRIGSGTR